MGVVSPCARFCPEGSQTAVEKSIASRTIGECAVRIRISAIWSALDSKALRKTSSRIGSILGRTGSILRQCDDDVVEPIANCARIRRHYRRAFVLLDDQWPRTRFRTEIPTFDDGSIDQTILAAEVGLAPRRCGRPERRGAHAGQRARPSRRNRCNYAQSHEIN